MTAKLKVGGLRLNDSSCNDIGTSLIHCKYPVPFGKFINAVTCATTFLCRSILMEGRAEQLEINSVERKSMWTPNFLD